jgi:hypothetical protein
VARRPKGSRLSPERWGALQTDHAHPYLQKREIARREGRLEDTRDAALTFHHHGAASRQEPTGVQPRQFTGMGLTLALGCAWSRPTHFHSLHKKARRDGWLTGASFDDGEHKDMDCPGATSRRGRLYARLVWPAASPRACRGAWPQPCSRTHGLAMPARRGVWCPDTQHETGRQCIHRFLHNNPQRDDRFPDKFLARRRWCTRASVAQELLPVAVRQFCSAKASTQAG